MPYCTFTAYSSILATLLNPISVRHYVKVDRKNAVELRYLIRKKFNLEPF